MADEREQTEQEGAFTSTAVAFDVIAPPLGIFIAAMPLVKLLKRRHATAPERFVAAIVEGAGKPVGGDAEGVVRPAWVDDEKHARASAASLKLGATS